MKNVTHERLKEAIDYNPITGVFMLLVRTRKRKPGIIASNTNPKNKYARISLDGKLYLAHRLAWFYVHGEWPAEDIDHINHCKTDNRMSNLRSVTRSQNLRNMSLLKRNTSGRVGVSWIKAENKWCAQICVQNKIHLLGNYTHFYDAVAARERAEEKYGFHENHGKVNANARVE